MGKQRVYTHIGWMSCRNTRYSETDPASTGAANFGDVFGDENLVYISDSVAKWND